MTALKSALIFTTISLTLIVLAHRSMGQGWVQEQKFADQHFNEARAADERAHINAAGGTPNSPGRSYGPSGNGKTVIQDVQEREQQRRKEKEEKLKAQKEYYAEWDKRLEAERLARIKSTNDIVGAYVRGFREDDQGNSPFTSDEVTKLAYLCVNYKGEILPTEPEVKKYLRYYKAYEAVAKTGSYEEVTSAIAKFPHLSEKASAAYEQLNYRFPDRKTETIRSLMKFWNTGGIVTSLPNWEGDLRYIITTYPNDFKLELANASLWGASLYYGFATIIKSERAKGPSNKATLMDWENRFLSMAPPNLIKGGVQDCLTEMMDALSNEELMALGAKLNVSPACLAMHLPYKKTKASDPDSDYPDRYYDYFLRATQSGAARPKFVEVERIERNFYELRSAKAFPAADKIKYFAEKGDPESMSIYGIMILRSYYADKEGAEAIPWLQKAAAAGAPYGVLNLKDACQYAGYPRKGFKDIAVKGLKDFCREQDALPWPARTPEAFFGYNGEVYGF